LTRSDALAHNTGYDGDRHALETGQTLRPLPVGERTLVASQRDLGSKSHVSLPAGQDDRTALAWALDVRNDGPKLGDVVLGGELEHRLGRVPAHGVKDVGRCL
jgi:hypothetical protein